MSLFDAFFTSGLATRGPGNVDHQPSQVGDECQGFRGFSERHQAKPLLAQHGSALGQAFPSFGSFGCLVMFWIPQTSRDFRS